MQTTLTCHVFGAGNSNSVSHPSFTNMQVSFIFSKLPMAILAPAKEFPELGKTLIRFLRKEVGEVDLHPKNPMFAQDFEHILDTIGLETPAAMQRKRIR